MWVLNGEPYAGVGGIVIEPDGSKVHVRESRDSVTEMHPGAWQVPDRVKTLDEEGIYATIAFTNGGLGRPDRGRSQGPAGIAEAVQTPPCWTCRRSPGNRILPMAVLPVWDIDETVKEMKRLTDLDVRGYSVQDHPEKLEGIPGYLHERWAPFWEQPKLHPSRSSTSTSAAAASSTPSTPPGWSSALSAICRSRPRCSSRPTPSPWPIS